MELIWILAALPVAGLAWLFARHQMRLVVVRSELATAHDKGCNDDERARLAAVRSCTLAPRWAPLKPEQAHKLACRCQVKSARKSG